MSIIECGHLTLQYRALYQIYMLLLLIHYLLLIQTLAQTNEKGSQTNLR